LNQAIEDALNRGDYEGKELAAMTRHLTPQDRVLDLGGGAGYLAVQAAKIVGPANVTTVEANPDMVQSIKKNTKLNGVDGVRILHGAVVGDDYPDETITFEARAAFWSSTIYKGAAGKKSILLDVAALKLSAIFEEFDASLVVMDVEGAEAALAQQDWPESVGFIIMEIHPQFYGLNVIQKIFDGLSRSGFAYMPWGLKGNVVVFQRVEDA
jgi:FkbM family methyltransferase